MSHLPGSRSDSPVLQAEHDILGASYIAARGSFDRCVLLFSGGLDTSCLVKYITDVYACEVTTLTLNVGQHDDFAALERHAYSLGAKSHVCIDARHELIESYCFRAIKANAVVGRYGHPLSASLTRPLMIKHAIDVAARESIPVLAHGASGRSNDSLRFDTSALTLDPGIRILAPVREWKMSREAELAYAAEHDIQVAATPERSYSIDDNLWARETEAGQLVDTGFAPPDDVFSLVAPIQQAPDNPETVTLDFVEGLPVALDGQVTAPLELVLRLNEIGSRHGVGRFDTLEERGVGIKMREIHEAPAAEILVRAHADLQELVMTRDELRLSRIAEAEWVDAALTGFWYTPLMEALNSFFDILQARMTGRIVMRLHKGTARVLTRTSPYALDLRNLEVQGFLPELNEHATAAFIEVVGLQRRASHWMAARARRDA